MKKIVLISCASKKKNFRTIAKDLYDSTLFKYALQYAQSYKPDKIYILSALYGLVDINELIDPYNKTLNGMSTKENQEWSRLVLRQLKNEEIDIKNDHFVILAGSNYRKNLVGELANYEIPLEGKRIGEQLSYLKGMVTSE